MTILPYKSFSTYVTKLIVRIAFREKRLKFKILVFLNNLGQNITSFQFYQKYYQKQKKNQNFCKTDRTLKRLGYVS